MVSLGRISMKNFILISAQIIFLYYNIMYKSGGPNHGLVQGPYSYGGGSVGSFFKKIDRGLKRLKPVTQGEKVVRALGLDNMIPVQYRPAFEGAITTGKNLGYGKKRRGGRKMKR